jgi:glucose-6-phosphate 1-dehydrogenase
VQNIFYTRFANPLFEPLWKRLYVRGLQITMAEDFGVEERGRFYDETGATRDVVQNHLLRVLANLTMDPPSGNGPEATRDKRAELSKAVHPLDPAHVVRGQYAGYRKVPGVRPSSTVETFVAVKLAIDNWRWAGVPIYKGADLYSCRKVVTTDRRRGDRRVQAAAARDIRRNRSRGVEPSAHAHRPRRRRRPWRARQDTGRADGGA